MRPPTTAMPSVMARERAWMLPCLDALLVPAAIPGKTSAILEETRIHLRTRGRDSAAESQRLLPTCFKDTEKDLGPSCLGVRFVQTGLRPQNIRYSPLSINIFGCHGGSHGSDNGAQDPGHAVQVVHPTGVLDLQFLLQDGLRRSRRARGRCWVESLAAGAI